MIITHQGAESIKIQFGDTVLAFNPISKESKIKSQSFGSDVVLISINHPDMNGVENAKRGDREPFVVKGPGEYETKEVFIKGFPVVSHYDGVDWINTIYSVMLEEMSIMFLGAIDTMEIPSEVAESVDSVDVLFVPIGGGGVLSASDAYKLAIKFEPKIIIPIHFEGVACDKDALKTFTREGGDEKYSPVDKLTIKRKDLVDKDGEVVVITAGI